MESFKPVRLAYNTYESDSGTDENLAPVIYLHGVTGAKEYWLDIPQNVANVSKRKCHAVDARNHGDSEWSDHFNFDENADDLLHFLDIMGIQKAILVGHSMGGITAIKTALRRPDRVESIVVEDMMVRKFPKKLMDTFLFFLTLKHEGIERAPPGLDEDKTRKCISEYVFARMPPKMAEIMKKTEQEPEVNIDFRVLRRDAEGHYHLRCNTDVILKSISEYETVTSEPEGVFDGPALFIHGTLSFLKVGDDKEHIKQFFPKAVFESFEADHSIHQSNPAKFTESILKFLS